MKDVHHRAHIRNVLRDVIADVTQIDRKRIRDQEHFEAYGINSMMVLALSEALERHVPDLPRTLFFEYRTLDALTNYFVRHHAERFVADRDLLVAESSMAVAPPAQDPSVPAILPAFDDAPDPLDLLGRRHGVGSMPRDAGASGMVPAEDIAIIGLAGRYPDADDLDTFWQNLCAGKDSIREVPRERWDHAAIYSDDARRDDQVYAKWGGFLDGVDRFDALFFRISPREAENMDPQERLFLETAWHAVEDAGYAAALLAGRRIGVFVGAMWSQYQLYGVEASARGQLAALSSSFASIANRVSFLFDWCGPSIAVDTMCSSSLTAIHLACQNLWLGECEAALVGGVNLTLHPNKYVHLSQNRFAATDGRCRAFGAGGDGYVPGEGVGCVMLKRRLQAERDGDHIYGVIKASAINHGGRTNGYTVPNPHAQGRVIGEALGRSGCAPSTVSYIEAHGTGTALGDPIELAGLASAFGAPDGNWRCAIGSVKSNIGHLEAAAGMASLTKVLLQLRHRTLVPSLHTEHLNPNIDWNGTPFRVQRDRAAWESANGLPLRAGISAFGAGGSNAHIIVEEYPLPPPASMPAAAEVFLLSARTEDELRIYSQRMADWLQRHGAEHSPADIAYTTRVGREAMSWRLVLVGSSPAEWAMELASYASNRHTRAVIVHAERTELDDLFGGETGRRMIRQLVEEGEWERLARLWCGGLEVNWASVGNEGRRRVPLPGYPFQGKRLWAISISPVAAFASPETVAEQSDARADGEPVRRWLHLEWRAGGADSMPPAYGEEPILVLLPYTSTLALSPWLERGGPFVPVRQDRKHTTDGQCCDFDDPGTVRALFDSLQGRRLAGVIDCLDLGAEPVGYRGRVALLQNLIAAYRTPLRLLHLSLDNRHASGAAFVAGLHDVLDQEYRRLSTHSVHVAPQTDATELARLIGHEWRATPASRVAYRDGRRWTQELNEWAGPSTPANVTADRYYLITGGTGGIGLAIAQWLADRGARKLALTGVRPLPDRSEWNSLLTDTDTDPELARKLRVLSTLPSDVELHFIPLSDREGLAAFLEKLRERGGVEGVFHCAGWVDGSTPAFIEKSGDTVARVAEPKLEGVAALHQALAGQPPRFMLLFSSVSSLYPELGVGLCDYAAANVALNRFAEHAHARGDSWVSSIIWQNWSEVGLGKVDSTAYRARGLAGLPTETGLAMLAPLLGGGLPPVVFPALVWQEFTGAIGKPLMVAEKSPSAAAAAKANSMAAVSVPVADDTLAHRLRELFAPVLRMDATEWPLSASFDQLGVDSILLVSLHRALEGWLKASIDPGLFLEHNNLTRLAAHLARAYPQAAATGAGAGNAAANAPAQEATASPQPVSAAPVTDRSRPVSAPAGGRFAIIGMACRFPKAPDLQAFRRNLQQGMCAITEVPASRWSVEQYYSPQPQAGKSISKWGGFVDGIEDFDSAAFELGESVAPHVDPIVRLAVESAIGSLRDAGYSEDELRGRAVGVFIGSRVANYAGRITAYDRHSVAGTGQNFIAAHVSQLYDLKGPALVLDSACSSSLLAVHLACRSLANGECEAAVAGGADVLLDERPYLMLSEGKALSPSGLCRTFDDKADGFVPGEGAGAVVLKTLERALADGDRIYAVVEGSAVNNDGRTMGITTPNPEMQQAVIRTALAEAGVDGASLSYIEAHGTGTRIGDPIELRGLTSVIREYTAETGFCAIGSVKTNIGHLLSAAGIASVIKVALGISHGELYPTLHCETPNPRFAFAESPFYPNGALRPWQPREGIRRAGISSFGFGGTNVHAILSDVHRSSPAYRPVREALAPVQYLRRRHWLTSRRMEAEPAEAIREVAASAPQMRAGAFRFTKRM